VQKNIGKDNSGHSPEEPFQVVCGGGAVARERNVWGFGLEGKIRGEREGPSSPQSIKGRRLEKKKRSVGEVKVRSV